MQADPHRELQALIRLFPGGFPGDAIIRRVLCVCITVCCSEAQRTTVQIRFLSVSQCTCTQGRSGGRVDEMQLEGSTACCVLSAAEET